MTRTAQEALSPNPETAPKSTREKLFETAVDLFSSRGFKGVSIRDLTRAIGIKESSFYNHYKSKDELIEAIFDYYKTAFSQTMPPEERLETLLATTPPDEFLRQGDARFLQRMTAPLIRKIWRIVFTEQYRDERAREIILQDMIRSPLAFTEKVFTKMIALGQIKPYDPKLLAVEYQYPVAFMFSNFLMLEPEETDTAELQKQLAAHIDFFWKIVLK
jgi:AcrR family transcriptional regulator